PPARTIRPTPAPVQQLGADVLPARAERVRVCQPRVRRRRRDGLRYADVAGVPRGADQIVPRGVMEELPRLARAEVRGIDDDPWREPVERRATEQPPVELTRHQAHSGDPP